jgi:hypothetical protein
MTTILNAYAFQKTTISDTGPNRPLYAAGSYVDGTAVFLDPSLDTNKLPKEPNYRRLFLNELDYGPSMQSTKRFVTMIGTETFHEHLLSKYLDYANFKPLFDYMFPPSATLAQRQKIMTMFTTSFGTSADVCDSSVDSITLFQCIENYHKTLALALPSPHTIAESYWNNTIQPALFTRPAGSATWTVVPGIAGDPLIVGMSDPTKTFITNSLSTTPSNGTTIGSLHLYNHLVNLYNLTSRMSPEENTMNAYIYKRAVQMAYYVQEFFFYVSLMAWATMDYTHQSSGDVNSSPPFTFDTDPTSATSLVKMQPLSKTIVCKCMRKLFMVLALLNNDAAVSKILINYLSNMSSRIDVKKQDVSRKTQLETDLENRIQVVKRQLVTAEIRTKRQKRYTYLLFVAVIILSLCFMAVSLVDQDIDSSSRALFLIYGAGFIGCIVLLRYIIQMWK